MHLAEIQLNLAHTELLRVQRARTEFYALTLTRIEAHEPIPVFLTDLPGHAQIEATVVKESARLVQADLEIKNARMDVALSKSDIMPRIYGRLEQDIYDRYKSTGQNLDTSVGLVIEGTFEGVGFSNWKKILSAGHGMFVGYPTFEQVTDFSSGILPLFPENTA